MEIRTAVESDLDGIANLHAISWQKTYKGMLSDTFLSDLVVSDRLVFA